MEACVGRLLPLLSAANPLDSQVCESVSVRMMRSKWRSREVFLNSYIYVTCYHHLPLQHEGLHRQTLLLLVELYTNLTQLQSKCLKGVCIRTAMTYIVTANPSLTKSLTCISCMYNQVIVHVSDNEGNLTHRARFWCSNEDECCQVYVCIRVFAKYTEHQWSTKGVRQGGPSRVPSVMGPQIDFHTISLGPTHTKITKT